MGNRRKVTFACEELNQNRNVFEGTIDKRSFFQNMRGDLLIAGENAGDQNLILSLINSCVEKADMPTILLSGHLELFEELQRCRSRGEIANVRISGPSEKSYHPLLGMSKEQIQRMVSLTAQEIGIGAAIEKVIIYTEALLDIIAVKYPLSLPAMTEILREEDHVISELALQYGLPSAVADNIRGNHEAGKILRKICAQLEEIFRNVSAPGNDTLCNLPNGIKENISLFAFYSISGNNRILNAYLKEEIYNCLELGMRFRVLLDEMTFEGERDELLQYLLQEKHTGRIELIFLAQNPVNALKNPGDMSFANIVMFSQSTPAATEELSDRLFGKYQYYFPVPTEGTPPHLLFTFQRTVTWQIHSEPRLRVRSQDLHVFPFRLATQVTYVALKTMEGDAVYLVRADEFMQNKAGSQKAIDIHGGEMRDET